MYTFSELVIVANVCVSILNGGAVERTVQFEVHTGVGNASGEELLPMQCAKRKG